LFAFTIIPYLFDGCIYHQFGVLLEKFIIVKGLKAFFCWLRKEKIFFFKKIEKNHSLYNEGF